MSPGADRAFALHAYPETALHDSNDLEVSIAWHVDRLELTNAGGRYDICKFDGVVEQADLLPADVPVLVACALAAVVHPDDAHKVRGTVIIFTRTEYEKARRRRITWTKAYNDAHPKATSAPNRGNATRESSRHIVLQSKGAITLDFKAWFDFFPLDEDVTWFECFRVGDTLLRNLTMAMGKVSSTSVATSATRVIGAFDMGDGVTFKYATDGVIFAGPREAVIDAAWKFVQRATQVNAVIKELEGLRDPAGNPRAPTRDDIAALWKTKDVDWVGDVIDFDAKTIRCRQKHVDRMTTFRNACLSASATHADFVRAWAMFQYMSSTLGIPRSDHYSLRVHFSTVARRLAANPSMWNKPCDARPDPTEFYSALSRCIANTPSPIHPAPVIEAVSIVDASGVAFGGIICQRRKDGSVDVRLLQQRWRGHEIEDLNLRHSTRSEPEALARTAEAAWLPLYNSGGAHLMLTDHEGFALAHSFGGSLNPHYNARIQSLRRHRVDTVAYTPGVTNIADKYSRLQAFKLTAEDRAAAMVIAKRYIGRTVGEAFRIGG